MTKRPAKPKRQKKSDRLLHSEARKEEIMVDYALAPMDRLAVEMDRKWGIDMLPELVSIDTAQKYGSAMAKLNAAIEANDPAETKTRAEVVMRGLQAMDAEATRLGAQPASTDVWETELNGVKYGVMKDGRAWQQIQDQRSDLKLVTLREVAVALEAWSQSVTGGVVEKVKEHFGDGADVVAFRPSGEKLEDDIPF